MCEICLLEDAAASADLPEGFGSRIEQLELKGAVYHAMRCDAMQCV